MKKSLVSAKTQILESSTTQSIDFDPSTKRIDHVSSRSSLIHKQEDSTHPQPKSAWVIVLGIISFFSLGTLIWLPFLLAIGHVRSENSKVLQTLVADVSPLEGGFHVSNTLSSWFGFNDVHRAIAELPKPNSMGEGNENKVASIGWESTIATAELARLANRFNPTLEKEFLHQVRTAQFNLGKDSSNTDALLQAIPQPREFQDKPTVTIQVPTQGPVTSFHLRVADQGSAVTGLSEADIELFSTTGQPYPQFAIMPEQVADIDSNIAILVDISQSMSDTKLSQLVQEVQSFIDACHPRVRLALIPFDHEATVAVPLTNDRKRLTTALASLKPRGATNITTALERAITLLSTAEGSKALLLCTDGMDKDLPNRIPSILEDCKRQSIVISTLGLGAPTLDRQSLQALTSGTNGTMLVAEDIDRITSMMKTLIEKQTQPSYRVVVLTKDLTAGTLLLRFRGDKTASVFPVRDTLKNDTHVVFLNP